jgi:hypothetical protein
MPYFTAETEVEIDPYEFLEECSYREKLELFKALMDEDFSDEKAKISLSDIFSAETYDEQELLGLFVDMWSNKLHIDRHQIDSMRKELRDKNIL